MGEGGELPGWAGAGVAQCSLTSPPTPAGNATRRPTAVTAATSCAVAVATTPTRTVWSSGATASTTGAATSPVAGVSAPWSATCASEAAAPGSSGA